jgi:iron complex transport system substrate-binding protein
MFRSTFWKRLLKAGALFALSLGIVSSGWAERVLQDESGHSVKLPDQVKRAICLTPSVTDTAYSLGAAPQIVAITDFTLFPPQAAQEKPSIGDILNPSIERILSFHPDVVIAVSTLNSPETIRGLERVHIPVFRLDGRGLAGVYSSILSIGRVLGRDREATALVEQLKTRQKRIEEEAKGKNQPRIFLALQLEPCITAGKGAFITELISVAGGRSVTADLTPDWLRVNLEGIIPRNPQYILLMKNAGFGLKEMQAQPGWKSLAAVKAGHILYADERLQIPGPSAFDGLEDLARQIRMTRQSD